MAAKNPKSAALRNSSVIDAQQIVADVIPFLRIAHHIPGRVRLKLDIAALTLPALHEGAGTHLKKAFGAIPGVRDIQFNLLARSCIVEYDSASIPDSAWPDLLNGRHTPSARLLLDLLATSATASSPPPPP
jgi:hypothetical protein